MKIYIDRFVLQNVDLSATNGKIWPAKIFDDAFIVREELR